MRYVLWIIAWTVSQRIMMTAGIVDYKTLFSTILQSLIAVVTVICIRNSDILMGLACVLIAIWCVMTFNAGEVVNALVGGVLNAVLVIMAETGLRRHKNKG